MEAYIMAQIIKLDPTPDRIFEDINKKLSRQYVRVIWDHYILYDSNKLFPVAVLRPLIIIYHDGRQFELDAVSEPVKASTLKSGGNGLRYTIRIKHTIFHLFMNDNTWFIERI